MLELIMYIVHLFIDLVSLLTLSGDFIIGLIKFLTKIVNPTLQCINLPDWLIHIINYFIAIINKFIVFLNWILPIVIPILNWILVVIYGIFDFILFTVIGFIVIVYTFLHFLMDSVYMIYCYLQLYKCFDFCRILDCMDYISTLENVQLQIFLLILITIVSHITIVSIISYTVQKIIAPKIKPSSTFQKTFYREYRNILEENLTLSIYVWLSAIVTFIVAYAYEVSLAAFLAILFWLYVLSNKLLLNIIDGCEPHITRWWRIKINYMYRRFFKTEYNNMYKHMWNYMYNPMHEYTYSYMYEHLYQIPYNDRYNYWFNYMYRNMYGSTHSLRIYMHDRMKGNIYMTVHNRIIKYMLYSNIYDSIYQHVFDDVYDHIYQVEYKDIYNNIYMDIHNSK